MPGLNVKACSLAIALAASVALPAAAQDYPTRPMTIIGTTPGGASVDLVTRFFGERVKDKTGQPWVVENTPGAAGSIAAKAAASAKPDGYTLFLCTSGALSANQYLQKGLPYDPAKDFTLIARMFRLDFTLMVNPEKTPVKSLAELTAFLKAKKGRVSFGYFSSSMQALAEQYRSMIGIEASPAAYRNPAQMMTELEAGDFDFSFTAGEYALNPNPKLRAIAIGAEKRSALLPDVPTMVEAGLPGFLPLYSWFGLCAPSGAPDVVAKTLAPIIIEIAKRDE
ncbi:MAG: Bug family tripartite tricarboxylate transporter substrate binding protein, partial [Xanthobacteraceae bacterium]